jgi:two-component system NtrC family sensor kinase
MVSLSRIIETIRVTVRYKLLALVLFPILLVMPMAFAMAIYWGKEFSYDQLFIKVNTDLSVAHDVFKRIREDYLNRLGILAESHAFYLALQEKDTELIKQQLAILKNTTGFDYLNILDTDGKLLFDGSADRYDRVSALTAAPVGGR